MIAAGNRLADYAAYRVRYPHGNLWGTFPLDYLTDFGRKVYDACKRFAGKAPPYRKLNARGMSVRWVDVDSAMVWILRDWLMEQDLEAEIVVKEGTLSTREGRVQVTYCTLSISA